MRYRGREIDAVKLWGRYVDFPSSTRADETFSPKVQCPNPEHDTLKHHFQVNLKEPKVHCFAHCGISGSYDHAICVVEGLYEKYGVELEIVRGAWDKPAYERSSVEREQLQRQRRAHRQARKIILGSATGKAAVSSPVPKANLHKSVGVAASAISSSDLSYDTFLPPVALEYLKDRKISESSISKWQIGWLREEKRIAIPAHDENGHLRFLIKRAVLDSQRPKYLYTEGFPKTALLFGAGQIDLDMVKSHGLALVEGSIDAIVMDQHGLRITTAILGTGISEQQCRIIARIRPPRITLFFDKDAAGIHNIEIAARRLRKYPLYVARYPKGKLDPATLEEDEAWRSFEKAIPLRKFMNKLSEMGISLNPNVTRPKGALKVG